MFHLDPQGTVKLPVIHSGSCSTLPESITGLHSWGAGSLIFRKPSQNAKPNLNQTHDEPGAS